MIIFYWYIVVGLLCGCFMTYLLVRYIGWDELFDDYNVSYKLGDRFDLKIDTFKTIICLGVPLVTAFTWPYFVYLSLRKYFK